MSNNKLGADWERDVAALLREAGLPAVRLRGSGRLATGDIGGLPLFAVDCKNQMRLTPFQWLQQVRAEAANALKPFGAVVFKKRDASAGDAVVMMDLATFAILNRYILELQGASL